MAILDAVARVLRRRPDAAMADIADEAGVGRATCIGISQRGSRCYAVWPTPGPPSLPTGSKRPILAELAVDRAIGRLTAVFLRTGAKYAPLSQLDEYHDPAEKERVIKPVRADFSGRSS